MVSGTGAMFTSGWQGLVAAAHWPAAWG